MKKIVSMLLAFFTACSFAACGVSGKTGGILGEDSSNGTSNSTADGGDESQENSGGNSADEGNEDVGGEVIDRTKISDIATAFHEGLMFVWLGDNAYLEEIRCINTKGQIVFELEVPENAGEEWYQPEWGFSGKYAMMVRRDEDGYALCDKKGNLVKPEQLGATSFVVSQYTEDAFYGGYIFAKKTTSSFMGSVDELAIFNNKLEKLVDYSADLMKEFNANIYDFTYYNGYLYSGNFWINLRNGKTGNSCSVLYDEMPLINKSDFWAYNDDREFVYDRREVFFLDKDRNEVNVIIDLSPYKTDNNNIKLDRYYIEGQNTKLGDYYNGLAPVIFNVKESGGGKGYFTIMDEEGNFKFDPVELDKAEYYWNRVNAQVYAADNLFVVVSNDEPKRLYNIATYNENGKIMDKDFSYADALGSPYVASISDGVLVISKTNEKIFLDINTLEPLF